MELIELVDSIGATFDSLKMLESLFLVCHEHYLEGPPERLGKVWSISGATLQRLGCVFETLLVQTIEQAQKAADIAEKLQKDPA